jgi:hypothetical protein
MIKKAIEENYKQVLKFKKRTIMQNCAFFVVQALHCGVFVRYISLHHYNTFTVTMLKKNTVVLNTNFFFRTTLF